MFIKLIALLIALIALPDAYIYAFYVKRWFKKKAHSLLFFLPSVCLVAYMLLVRIGEAAEPSHQKAISIFMFVFLVICVPKAMFSIIDGIGRLISTRLKNESKKNFTLRVFKISAMAFSLTAILILFTGFFWGRKHFVVHQQTFVFDDLPDEFDGFRFVQFNDLHIGTFIGGHEKDVTTIVDMINAQNADAIMFVGDLVNYTAKELNGFEDDLSRLHAKYGVYAVMGNHDYSEYIRYATEAEKADNIHQLQKGEKLFGWNLLLNDNAIIRIGNDSIAVIGSENDGRPPFPHLGDLKKAMKGIDKGTFCIMMSHDPTHWRRNILPETDVQLTLAGHTHAGQFKVLGWSPVAFVYDEWSGPYSVGKQMINVSDGVGAVLFPFRFGAWPEINVITLKKSTNKS